MLSLYKKDEQDEIKKEAEKFLESILDKKNKATKVWVILEYLKDKKIKFFIDSYEEYCYEIFKEVNEEWREKGAFAVCLSDHPKVSEFIIENWGNSFFSFFISSLPNDSVVEHFSSISLLKEDNKSFIFRFYDTLTFSNWIFGLEETNRVNEALGIFTTIYTESFYPNIVTKYILDDDGVTISNMDLLNMLDNIPQVKNNKLSYVNLGSYWDISSKEKEHLAPVPIESFKRNVCRIYIKKYSLLEKHKLEQIYEIVSNNVALAMGYGLKRKDVIASFVEIYFSNFKFWDTQKSNMKKIFTSNDLTEVEKVEEVLALAEQSNSKEEI